MNRHRFSDTQIIELLLDPIPAATARGAEFAERQTPERAMPRPPMDPPTARKTRARRVLYVTVITAALSVLAASLPVAVVTQPAASAATVAPVAVAASGAPTVASMPAPPGMNSATWPLQRRFDVRRDDPSMPGTQPATDSLRIIPTQASFNPTLVRAFEALHDDQLAAAEADYASVLTMEPHNTDALQGMAAVALRRGQTAKAEAMFRLAVEADPMNAAAQAGLVALQPPEQAPDAESRLKGLIAAQPEEHRLRFALGNVLAARERWQEAQQEYFHAHAGDPQQPDYLFNLAVSLDRLHQRQLAADYYAAALAAAALRPAQFEHALASARLGELAE